MEGDTITMQEIFQYERTGISPQGQVIGPFSSNGNSPALCRQTQGLWHATAAHILRGNLTVMFIAFLVFLFALFLVLGSICWPRTGQTESASAYRNGLKRRYFIRRALKTLRSYWRAQN